MKIRSFAAFGLTWLTVTAFGRPVAADAIDYRFEPTIADVVSRQGATLTFLLVHVPTAKAVPNAVISRTRLDMSPDDMAAMTAKHELLPETEPGIYRIKADLKMAGGWALKLMAKVQGEPDTIIGTVKFTAKD